MIENNTWYYTLSTIAQTLAAILALGGTFIIFKLNTINDRINTLRDRAFQILATFEQELTRTLENIGRFSRRIRP